MPKAILKDVSLNYTLSGPEGAPILMFSNSLGTNYHMWDQQAALFSKNWRVLRYDTRGHGASEVTPGPYTIDQLAGDVINLLDYLKIERVHFCGLSMGGFIGQALALGWPSRITSLVLANTAAYLGPKERWDDRLAMIQKVGLRAISKDVLGLWFTDGFLESAPDIWTKMQEMYCANDLDGNIASSLAIRDADFRNDIKRIQMPTLIIYSVNDLATPAELSKFIGGEISGAILAGINQAGHISNIEQPEIFNAHLGKFLNENLAVA